MTVKRQKSKYVSVIKVQDYPVVIETASLLSDEDSLFEEDSAVRTSSVKGMANYSPLSNTSEDKDEDDEDYIIPGKNPRALNYQGGGNNNLGHLQK